LRGRSFPSSKRNWRRGRWWRIWNYSFRPSGLGDRKALKGEESAEY